MRRYLSDRNNSTFLPKNDGVFRSRSSLQLRKDYLPHGQYLLPNNFQDKIDVPNSQGLTKELGFRGFINDLLDKTVSYNKNEVATFLLENHDTAYVFSQSIPEIRRFFGYQTKLRVSIVEDPESENAYTLNIRICTSLPVSDARKILSSFYNKWFFKRPFISRRKITFGFEFS